MEGMECDDERDQTDEKSEAHLPEVYGESVAADFHVVSEVSGKDHYGAVDEEYAPVGKGLLRKIPVCDSLKKIHILKFIILLFFPPHHPVHNPHIALDYLDDLG